MPKDDEEPLVNIPEFNERDFIYNEKERAKSIVIVFVIAALVGIASGYLQLIGYWYFAILLIIVVLLFSEHILSALKVKFSRKATHRILLVGELFLTWLVFWILVLNPPLTHVSGPEISGFQIYQNGTWTTPSVSSSRYSVPFGTTDSFRVYMFAYSGISSYSVTYSLNGEPSTPISSHLSNNYLYFNISSAANYDFGYVTVTGSTLYHGSNLTSTITYDLIFSIPPPSSS